MEQRENGGRSAAGPVPPPACSELVGGAPSRRIRFGSSLTIGRHAGNGLRIDENEVSSFHAVIEWVEEGWTVRDLGSRNGTSLNGRRLNTRFALREGDVLRFARGGAWCVARLARPAEIAPDVGLARTVGLVRSPPPGFVLELLPIRPGVGLVVARWEDGEELRQELSGTVYLLLDRLACAAGQWVTDVELRRSLWGKRGEYLTRSALHTPIYNLRRQFEGWGIDGGVIEKDQGATRLILDPAQVRRGARLDAGADGAEG